MKTGLGIVVWIAFAIALYALWPYKVTQTKFVDYTEETTSGYDIRVNAHVGDKPQQTRSISLSSLLYQHVINNIGRITITLNVSTPVDELKSVHIVNKNFSPGLNLEFCNRVSRLRPYCSDDARQELGITRLPKTRTTDRWNQTHHVGDLNSEASDVAFNYLLELCPITGECFEVPIQGVVKANTFSAWHSPIFRFLPDSIFMVPALLLAWVLILYPLARFIPKVQKGKDDGWLASTLFSVGLAPPSGILFAYWLTRNVSNFEGARGYAFLYSALIIIPVSFIVFLLLSRKFRCPLVLGLLVLVFGLVSAGILVGRL